MAVRKDVGHGQLVSSLFRSAERHGIVTDSRNIDDHDIEDCHCTKADDLQLLRSRSCGSCSASNAA